MPMGKLIYCMAVLSVALGACTPVSTPDQAPPLANSPRQTEAVVQQDISLTASRGREIPLRIYFPADGCSACTLIFFSHGASLTHDSYRSLIHNWALRDYVVAAPLHTDSELHPDRENYNGFDWVTTRIEDYQVISSALLGASVDIDDVTLSGTVIAAGHSFGALTAQIAGGAELHPSVAATLDERAGRPLAVIAISPPGPVANYTYAEGWSKLDRPMVVVTGTADRVPNFAPTWELHLASYHAAPAGSAYLLVFDDIDHYFNGAFGRPAPQGFVYNDETVLLNRIIIDFIRAVEADDAPSAAEWRSLSRPGLKAEAR